MCHSKRVTALLLFLGLGGAVLGIWLAPEGHTAPPVGFAIVATVVMYNLWRRRSPNRWLRGIFVYGLPTAWVLLILMAATGEVRWPLTLAFAGAAVFGAAFGSFIELFSGGARPAIIRARWRDTTMVGAETGDVPVVFDVRPLTAVLSKQEIRARRGVYPKHPMAVPMTVQKALFLVGWPIIGLLIPVAFTDEDYVTGPGATSQILGMTAFFSLLILGYVIFGVLGVRGWRQLTSVEEHIRLHSFADLNGFDYHPGPLGGPDGSTLTRVMRNSSGWIMANVMKPQEPVEGSVAPVTKFSGLIEVQLPHRLPHIFMRRTGLRAPSFSSSRAPAPQQRLRLEGDFDKYFETYCPKEYERDALYLLTPDVLVALIDSARDFDVEIIDDRLIFRSRADVVTCDPAVWQSIARVVSAFAVRAHSWMTWRDDRHVLDAKHVRLISDVPTGVAKAGRRLTGTLSIGALLTGAYAVLFGVLVWLSNGLS